MRFIQSYELNKSRWDQLAENHQTYYQLSWFLDLTAKKWCVLVDESYSKGIALAYNEVLGKKIIYPTIYGRTSAFIGCTAVEIKNCCMQIEKEFQLGQLQLEERLLATSWNEEVRCYQLLEELNYTSLAKRMLNKARKAAVEIKPVAWKEYFFLIKEELAPKVKSIQGENLLRLENLLQKCAELKLLSCQGIFVEGKCCGVMYYVQEGQRMLYVKGAATSEIKKIGGMYLAMDEQIKLSLDLGLTFDFGGSSIEGIRRFFLAFGGQDKKYYCYTWDYGPWWFRLLRRIKSMVSY